MDIEHVPRTRPGWPELVRRVQRELDQIAVGTIITGAFEYKGGLRLEIEHPSGLTPSQRSEIERIIDNAQVASSYL